ncbi:MAG: DUF523 and DUF1722 domain-containing protein [Sulfurimonas sp.]|uniref:DUF523 and DUF1722 domain-containing protein n=1 Tax=Sulfurimonas sp. TaxID=2022749 RepID=UPI002603B5C3|nr:DUF523 and DUF1722 domain-containing protein [Sulfurimonas sp.]MDD5400358.1 DUF523 and DUF1722 domain-containing protein [Sulfurimonas sp.]
MNIAVSACLLGQNVRYDGGHKQDKFITDELSRYASFVPFCPEAIAFGTPRSSIRLASRDDAVFVFSNENDSDLTRQLLDKVYEEMHKIAEVNLSGIIFKSKSPSCGMGSAKTYLENGNVDTQSDGVFVTIFKEKFPLLPMEEESRLQDERLRENFMMHLFAYDSIEKLKESSPNIKSLVDFHLKNKLLLQTKDEKLCGVLENIVTNHENLPFDDLFANYEYNFKVAISKKALL